MEEVKGLFAVFIDVPGTGVIQGPWSYEEAVDRYHSAVQVYACFPVRLVKISFLD